MKRTAAELQLMPFTLTLPAYRIAQLQQLADDTNAQHRERYGYDVGTTAGTIAAALLIQALERIEKETNP
jgi:hypothetical protein